MSKIILKDISKSYIMGSSSRNILDHISLTIEEGEFTSIIGKSGVGKSTLLHIIGLMEEPTNGEYWFYDNKINYKQKNVFSKIRSKEIGLIMQDYGLISKFSVFDNIATPLYINHFKKKDIMERVEKAACLVHISPFLDSSISTLSGGEKQRVAIARSLVMSPKLILADEPTSSLDNDERDNILDIFRQINKLGTTILVATHDPLVAAICNKRYKLDDGILINVH